MSVRIGNVELGSGMTKICVPVIGDTKENILEQVRRLKNSVADIIEWRVDFYQDVSDWGKLLEMAQIVRKEADGKPVLFTFRTAAEGGEKSIEPEEYRDMLVNVIKSGYADAVDVELFMGERLIKELVTEAKECGVTIVASNHDFNKTPDETEIINRLVAMKDAGAHVSKIAVMPLDSKDVLNLMVATQKVKALYSDMVVISMAMGQPGVISRMSGALTGSAVTFGAIDKKSASAPGQIDMNTLKYILNILEGKED